MPHIEIGLSSERLSEEAVIDVWRALEDPIDCIGLASDAIVAMFQNPAKLWEVARGESQVVFYNLRKQGMLSKKGADRAKLRSAFDEGIEATMATYWVIRSLHPKITEGALSCELADDFEPKDISETFFPNNPNIVPITSKLLQTLNSPDPDVQARGLASPIVLGNDYGMQFALQCLGYRHQAVLADFETRNFDPDLLLTPN